MPKKPRGRKSLRAQEMGSELLIYDKDTDQIHILNETAVQIWHLCDGRHEEEDLVAEMMRRYPGVEEAMVRRDLKIVIDDFRAKGLVEEEEKETE